MATAKVRIFELAKELGISSKELIGLFERLGLEAKNQLSVVDDKIADLVRGVLLRKGQAAAANAAKASAATAVAEPEPITQTESALPPEPVVAQAAVAAPVPNPLLLLRLSKLKKASKPSGVLPRRDRSSSMMNLFRCCVPCRPHHVALRRAVKTRWSLASSKTMQTTLKHSLSRRYCARRMYSPSLPKSRSTKSKNR